MSNNYSYVTYYLQVAIIIMAYKLRNLHRVIFSVDVCL